MKRKAIWTILLAGILAWIVVIGPAHILYAATAKEIDVSVDAALEKFSRDVMGAKDVLKMAKGILVLPRVTQAGVIAGGEYGEGALRIGGKTVDYYSIAAATFGLQLGAQEKDIIIAFMDEEALKKFQSSDGWQAGINGTVAAIDQGTEGSIDTTKMNQPIIGFVVGQRGLMVGANIEGAKFSKLKR